MFPFTSRHIRPIGLEIGPQGICLFQLDWTSGRPTVIAAGSCALSKTGGTTLVDPSSITRSIKQVLSAEPFVGRRVTATLPQHLVHLRTVRVPILAHDQIDAAARQEAAGLFKFDLSRALVRLIRAGQVRQGEQRFEEVIVAAVRQLDCQQFIDILHNSGLRPGSLQLRQLALYRAATRVAPADAVHAVIEVGHLHTNVIMGAGANITFIRTIDIGAEHFQQAIARKLGLEINEAQRLRSRIAGSGYTGGHRRDPVAAAVFDATRGLHEELANQVSRSFRYHAIAFRGPLPQRAMLLGTEQNDQHLRAMVSAAISLPIESPDLLHGIDATGAADQISSSAPWAAVLGLELPAPADASRALVSSQLPPPAMAA